ncbi:type II toxin-antitoxin system Phd/YefM family antitoxin [Aetokthonos hydrillicola Thurmond2011]|jgi:prevent-host-death family protein|uniref:Antitoxin n=1 Tax=Aetokthonos hydrillicola Thurmond2011 TaxID=2712845 RepID=A0AAP5I826_9CYAN|nr:type II toxin-antitoxin system Phd/YefM family antitoxin [Aetokthonos hydrillicola]MBO3459071.1 type II toxin-antitoxin system Phd/YefM family antitoxin [Aetokthonos hydrillicola CCALA 1050]MBW4584755.1 type II toxin-antitoxin system Phd/YefM family antitoxin [Aetokthonos hydrillicola CCALA 1050]MDR9895302.1 type II toxin-antitoxin system Phd/YefM family antitoxin [Aetokthonos hydrillicola Thurmond2011]
MIDLAKDIHSLTDFKRNTTEFVQRMKETKHPLVLTVNGKAELVVQDAESYQALLEAAEFVDTVKSIRRALEQVKRGEGRPADEVIAELRQELGISDE